MNAARQPQSVALLAVLLGLVSSDLRAEPQSLLSRRQPGDTTRVELLLEVGGDLKISEQGQTKALKLSVVGKMSYDERIAPASAGASGFASARHYDTAEAVIKIDAGGSKPTLRKDRRLVLVNRQSDETTLYSPEGALTREELDLLDVPGNSLMVDELLPEKPVSVGDRWNHAEALMAGLLGLEAVSKSEVVSELKEVNATSARIDMAGTVQGAIGGVATQVELKGRYKFDRHTGRVTWMALLVEEKRSIGHVGPGADIVARLQMTIAPIKATGPLADAAAAQLPWQARPEDSILEYTAANRPYRFLHDRRWHVTDDRSDTVALRLVDRGDLVAQCNVTQLPKGAPGKHPTLAAFQSDIQRSIGKEFGQFIGATESTHPAGHVIYRVIAQGEVAELPIEWHYYLVADANGNQVALVFTVEQSLVEKLADADQSIVSAVEFVATENVTAAQPATKK